MQRIFLLVMLVLFTRACNFSDQNTGAYAGNPEQQKIVSATVEEMLATPADYDGKEVAVSGLVTHVCRHGGQKCFVLGEDGETQIRIVPAGEIDEFKIELEGSTVAFKGTFKVLNPMQAQEHITEQESMEHHENEMAHSAAENADYFIEATDFKELTQ